MVEVIESCTGEIEAFQPVENPGNVEVEWRFEGLSTDGAYANAINLPMIGNLNDDDGDGLVTEYDTPDIVAVVFPDAANYHRGKLVALNGISGEELFAVDDINAFGGGGMADIDGDGMVEIVVFDYAYNLKLARARLLGHQHQPGRHHPDGARAPPGRSATSTVPVPGKIYPRARTSPSRSPTSASPRARWTAPSGSRS